MKDRIAWIWGFGSALAVLALATGCEQEASSSPDTNTVVEAPVPSPQAAVPPAAAEELAPPEQTAESDISQAPYQPVSTEATLPANVRSSGPAAEVIQLAQSGVEEEVMLSFVTNSMSTFNLRADEIIYLNDIGVPGDVVTAMMQRDETLKEFFGKQVVEAQAAPAPGPAPDQAAPYAAAPAPAGPPPAQDYTTGAYPAAEDATYAGFYDSMAPYGAWVDVGGYGRCWRPNVMAFNAGWQPYFDGGRWIYTDCGWYWMSDYSWGWAPFHYGRWFRHARLGWCWWPDRVWGPSWVSWRHTADYCGWAPLPPGAAFTAGIGITWHGRLANSGFTFGLGRNEFRFIPWPHFRDRHLNRFAVSHEEAGRIFPRTVDATSIVVRHNTIINNGITPERVAAATRTPVPRVALHDVNAAAVTGMRAERLEGNGKALAVYRPHWPQNTRAGTALPAQSNAGKNSVSILGGQNWTRNEPLPPSAGRMAEQPDARPRLQAPKDGSRYVPGGAIGPVAPGLAKPAANEPFPNRLQRSTPQMPQRRTADMTARVPNIPTRPAQPAPLILRGPDRPAQAPQSQWRPPWLASRDNDPPARADRPQPVARPEMPGPSASSETRFSRPPSVPAQVPHYALTPAERSRAYDPPPNQAPQRAFAAPQRSARLEASESRPAPSAPATPAPSSSSHSQSSSDNSSGRGSRNSR